MTHVFTGYLPRYGKVGGSVDRQRDTIFTCDSFHRGRWISETNREWSYKMPVAATLQPSSAEYGAGVITSPSKQWANS